MVEETKICPYCAETIKAAAIVCRYCRRELAESDLKEVRSDNKGGNLRKKKVWLAVVLNLFPWIMGLGYIYLRKYGRFAIVFSVQLLFNLMPMIWLGLSEYNTYLLFIFWIWTLFDVHKQARSYNANLQMA
jgi:hypothetical protein